MENENNAPADEAGGAWSPGEPVAADEKAKAEIAYEREANRIGAATENLQNLAEPHVEEEAQARADLDAVLAQSIDGRSLSQRQVNYARESALAYEKEHPELSEAVGRLGAAIRESYRLRHGTARGRHAAEWWAGQVRRPACGRDRPLDCAGRVRSALPDHPVGSASYSSPQVQRRVQACSNSLRRRAFGRPQQSASIAMKPIDELSRSPSKAKSAQLGSMPASVVDWIPCLHPDISASVLLIARCESLTRWT